MGVGAIGSNSYAYRIPDDDLAPPPPPPEPTANINGNEGGAVSRLDETTATGGVQRDEIYNADGVIVSRERTVNTVLDVSPYQASDQLVFETTGDGDDRVEVRSNDDGTVDVYVNGQRFPVTLANGQEITIRTGAGDDVVWVDSDVELNIVVESGDGDDFIMGGAGNDRIDSGTGDDTVYGGDGRDDIFGNSGDDDVSGGDGNDVVYGGDGNDFMTGTFGDDYLEGGAGDDTVWGGSGDDILSGGRDGDTLEGDGGNDVVYTGLGVDNVENSGGRDQVYAQEGEDTVTIGQYADTGTTSNAVVNVVVSSTDSVQIDPDASPEFRQRVQADLDMLAASPTGQQLLADLETAADERGNEVIVTELPNEANGAAIPVNIGGTTPPNGNDVFATDAGPGTGTDSVVFYNPSYHTNPDPGVGDDGLAAPIIALHHELSHAYNMVTGTMQPGQYTGEGPDGRIVLPDGSVGIPNAERQATGLPSDPEAGGPNPVHATENGLRAELFPNEDNPSHKRDSYVPG